MRYKNWANYKRADALHGWRAFVLANSAIFAQIFLRPLSLSPFLCLSLSLACSLARSLVFSLATPEENDTKRYGKRKNAALMSKAAALKSRPPGRRATTSSFNKENRKFAEKARSSLCGRPRAWNFENEFQERACRNVSNKGAGFFRRSVFFRLAFSFPPFFLAK